MLCGLDFTCQQKIQPLDSRIGLIHLAYYSSNPFIYCKCHGVILFYSWITMHCVYICPNLFIHTFIEEHLGWFHKLTILNYAAININVVVSLSYADFHVLWVNIEGWHYWIKWWIHTLKNIHITFQRGCNNLPSHQ